MDKLVVVCDWLLLKNIVIRNFYLTTLGCYYCNMIVYYYKVLLHGWATLSVGGPTISTTVQDTSLLRVCLVPVLPLTRTSAYCMLSAVLNTISFTSSSISHEDVLIDLLTLYDGSGPVCL